MIESNTHKETTLVPLITMLLLSAAMISVSVMLHIGTIFLLTDVFIVYVMSANATKLDVLSLNAPGQAKNIQSLDLAGPTKNAGLTISKSVVTSND